MKRVAIIGAGLAGTACAYVLKRYGLEPVIYERSGEIASGASGNVTALYNPRLSAMRGVESEFFTAAFTLALPTFEGLPSIGWRKCGSLHLMNDGKRTKKFEQCVENWGWPAEHMRLVEAREASEVAGVEIGCGALWLPDAGIVSPRKLCERYAEGVEVHLNAEVASLEDIKADAVIVACGMGAKNFVDLPLKAVRGQITEVKANDVSNNLRSNICYGGYVAPAVDGVHALGATFQRWLDHSDIMPQDDVDNLEKLAANVLAMGKLEIVGHRSSIRATTDGHFPIVGRVQDNIYVSAAHGSHGVITSIAAAHLLADMIVDGPLSLPGDVVKKLSPF